MSRSPTATREARKAARAGATPTALRSLGGEQRSGARRLTLGAEGDAFEQQADDIAHTLGAAFEGAAPLAPAPTARASSGGGEGLSPELEGAIQAQRGGGEGLAPLLRPWVEGALGPAAANVRIHRGEEAGRLVKEVGSDAFAVGHDVFFRPEAYQPHSQEGRALIFHEVAHTQQQGSHGASVQRGWKSKVKSFFTRGGGRRGATTTPPTTTATTATTTTATATPAVVPTLDQCIADARWATAFQQFCDRGYGGENVEFILAVDGIDSGPQTFAAAADALRARYIQAGSLREINLPAELRARLVDGIQRHATGAGPAPTSAPATGGGLLAMLGEAAGGQYDGTEQSLRVLLRHARKECYDLLRNGYYNGFLNTL